MSRTSIAEPTDMPGYGPTARALHWIIAILLAAQFLVAWTMEIPEDGAPPTLSGNLHASIGFSIFVIIVVRLFWRISHPVAPLPDLPGWQRTISVLTHALLYLALLIVPLAGVIMVMGEGVQVQLFGLVPLPMAGGEALAEAAEEAHELLATVLLILVGLHVVAALYHYFIRRDHVMRRMLPNL
jgi:cytochrome b561